MPLALLVRERLPPILAVPQGLHDGDIPDGPPGVLCPARDVEEDIDLFETAASGLGVEEVDSGGKDEVGSGEDDIGPPPDGRKGDGGDEDDDEIGEPVGGGGEGVGGSAHGERDEFDGPQPGHALPADGEEGDEDEDGDGDDDAGGGIVDGFGHGEHDHGHAHAR